METFLIKAAQFMLALAFLVIVHEFGHYIFSRIFGIRVEKFYMFFDPWFSLAKWKPKAKPGADPDKTSWRDTEYGIGWIPLGGYCKISGMIDESLDTAQMASEPKPWEFRSKPAWQRLLVMVAGVLFNFVLAVLIYAGIAWHWGTSYVPFDKATEGFDFVPAAQAAGFRNGDIPISADGVALDAADPDYALRMAEAREVKVLRNRRDTVAIAIPDKFILSLNEDKGFLYYRLPVYIDRVVAGEPAAKAGLLEGDRIVAVDTFPTPSYTELTAALRSSAGRPVPVTVERGEQSVTVTVTPTGEGKLGFQLRPLTDVYPVVVQKYGFFGSFPKGWELGTTTLSNYVSSMKLLFTREGASQVGGFGTIGSLFPARWDWLSFWEITAFISLALAFMNLLPIPGLDGGHIMFLLWEVITRRKVSENILINAQYAGMIFLILLMLYANANDIFRAFFK